MVAGTMFLRAKVRKKDGKQHRYFSVVENRRVGKNKTAQRTVLYLGEINDGQEATWRKTLQVFDESQQQHTRLSLFPEDREIPAESSDSIQVKLSAMELRRPRAFGNCWLGCELWRQLQLKEFWEAKLAEKVKQETVSWAKVLQLLVVNRLIDPGSEFRVAPAVVRKRLGNRILPTAAHGTFTNNAGCRGDCRRKSRTRNRLRFRALPPVLGPGWKR